MRHLLVKSTMVIGLAACGGDTNVEGDWEGECRMDSEDFQYDLEFELRVDDDKGGVIEGEGAYLYQGYVFDGVLDGSRDGTDVELTLEGEYGGYTVKLELDGVLERDDVEGTCRFGAGRGLFKMDR